MFDPRTNLSPSFRVALLVLCALRFAPSAWAAAEIPKPYAAPCTEREEVFEFTEKPRCTVQGEDKYEISFAVKGFCDVTVGILNEQGIVVRHLGSGVLGPNAPLPFQKNSLKQTIYWNGKDDLDIYHKDPSKLHIQVRLGLKPAFEKLLGDAGPKNLSGYVWGIAMAEDGAYVFAKGQGGGQIELRKFDRQGQYLATLFPPSVQLPKERLKGLSAVEYEPGRQAVHGRQIYASTGVSGFLLPTGIEGARRSVYNCQPIVLGDKIYFTNPGVVHGCDESLLHYLYTDGGTDLSGLRGSYLLGKKSGEMDNRPHFCPRLAASPDGRYVYLADAEATDSRVAFFVVWRKDLQSAEKATPFLGTLRKPGSDNQSFGLPIGLDCDAQGRLYVCDAVNNRIQIFSPEGKFLKTVAIERPYFIQVHRKSGALYVLHIGRKEGKSADLLTKFASFDDPKVLFQKDQEGYSAFALDHWSPKPRLWLAGGKLSTGYEINTAGPSVRIFEEDGQDLKLVADFDEEARKAGGEGYLGRWAGSGTGGSGIGGKLVCDPLRETAYFGNTLFDLKSGNLLGTFRIGAGTFDDFAFDKLGRMHVHFNPGFYFPGVGRVDPAQAKEIRDERTGKRTFTYPEMPYDYGEEHLGGHNTPWRGVLPVRDQPGAKFFQDGLGVDMRGNIAVESNIYYVPKMEEEGFNMVVAGMDQSGRREEAHTGDYSYDKFMKEIKEKEKRGEEVFSIRRQPGVPLAGATIWTFESTGEIRERCAATVGSLVNGVRIDEEGCLYFVNNRARIFHGKPFLADRTCRLGEEEKGILHLMSGTLLKTNPKEVRILQASAPVPLDSAPARPPELMTMGFYDVYGKGQYAWAEGAQWLYAGAMPIVQDAACSCPTQRFHLDWYKRSFVPESYRHSIGVLDANGNLILHLGRYGNYDSGQGARSLRPLGGDQISVLQARFLSGTDSRLVFTDWCQRIVVLDLAYQVEEKVAIRGK